MYLWEEWFNLVKKGVFTLQTCKDCSVQQFYPRSFCVECNEDNLELEKIDGVIHFAGLKDVSDSVRNPKKYFDVNVNGTKTLIKQLKKFDVKKIIFSSSATIYGEPKTLPIPESHPINAINPYGENKVAVEYILNDLCVHDDQWKATNWRTSFWDSR